MDTKAFEEKVLKILQEDYFAEISASEITSLIEPLLELVKAQDELTDILLQGWHNEEDMTEYPASLENRINELKKQIE